MYFYIIYILYYILADITYWFENTFPTAEPVERSNDSDIREQ